MVWMHAMGDTAATVFTGTMTVLPSPRAGQLAGLATGSSRC